MRPAGEPAPLNPVPPLLRARAPLASDALPMARVETRIMNLCKVGFFIITIVLRYDLDGERSRVCRRELRSLLGIGCRDPSNAELARSCCRSSRLVSISVGRNEQRRPKRSNETQATSARKLILGAFLVAEGHERRLRFRSAL